MKKSLKTILMCLSVTLVLTGCGKEFNSQLPSTDDNNSLVEQEPSTPKAETISLNQTVSLSDCEFYVEYAKLGKKIIPPKASGYYSYYEADSGKVYLDMSIAYKNLATTDVDADEIVSATLRYKDAYDYTGFAIIEEDSRSDFTYANITSIAPLTTEYVHYLFEVPESVSTEEGKMVVYLTVGGSTYELNVRDGSTSSTPSSNANLVIITDKEVKAKEKITVDGVAELYVEKSYIANKITPPKASGYYSYYEADSGKVYVDVIFAYKNLEGDDAEADEVIGAKLTYDSKYEYTGFTIIEEDSRSDFTYSNITSIAPLTTEYIHYLFEVPVAVKNGSESIVVNFNVGNNSYIYKVR